jgi:hypothetical protein
VTFSQRFGRRFGAVLASLALIVGILAPPGYMITPTAQGAELVICTGHGPLLQVGDLGHPGKAPKSTSDALCVFAGHGAAPAPELGFVAAPTVLARPLLVAKALIDQVPGRGLVAPPPPSQGPPVTL